jgi:hypothetical protein
MDIFSLDGLEPESIIYPRGQMESDYVFRKNIYKVSDGTKANPATSRDNPSLITQT